MGVHRAGRVGRRRVPGAELREPDPVRGREDGDQPRAGTEDRPQGLREHPEGQRLRPEPEGGYPGQEGRHDHVDRVDGAPKVAVPNVIDDPVDEATDKLEDDKYGFTVKTESKESSEEPGTVLEQDPTAGDEVEKGSTITLTVAKEKEQSTVPDVSGLSCDDAKARMEQNDLKGNCTDVETDDDNLVGKVVATSPTANSSADPGSTVNIQIGKAAEDEEFAMPKVTQMTLAQAKQVLAQNQLQLGNVQGSQDDNAIVLASNPQEGQQVKAGDRVNLGTIDAGQQNNGGNNNGGLIGGGG